MFEYDVIDFAKQELDKYLDLLGISADFTLRLWSEEETKRCGIKDPYFDDGFSIFYDEGCGYISGSNPRSVLMGVYRLFTEWGVRFVRPGKNGTYLPESVIPSRVQLSEVAEKRHRTMCIEGGVSIENALDMIEWLPKVGFNSYFIQFSDAFVFFDRWYSHHKNPFKKPAPFDYKKAAEYVELMTHEIKRRGMLLYRMGHGWHCDPFGIINHGWIKENPDQIPKEYVELCALVNGERKVWNDTPMEGQLCYSNPKVSSVMTKAVVDYARAHPETDVIIFWLGDWFNNTCECPECSKLHLSDYKINIINIITDELKRLGLHTKVAFDIAYNSEHPPKVIQIRNKDNLMMMFCPISRSYAQSFPKGFEKKEISEYKINNYKGYADVNENLAFLHAWEKHFDGDAIDFDYHLMGWDHVVDAGAEGIARVISEDIKSFGALGLNGLVSCQLQRNAFPSAIAMTVMAKTLWNSDADFDEIRSELYSVSFGEDVKDRMCEYFSKLSKGFNIGLIRSIKKHRDSLPSDFKERLAEAIGAMKEMESLIAERKNDKNPHRRESWELLEIHRQIYIIYGEALIKWLDGDEAEYERLRRVSVNMAWENEDKVQDVFDVLYYERFL